MADAVATLYAICSAGTFFGWVGLMAQGWPIELLWPVLGLSLLYAAAGLWISTKGD